MIAYFPGLSYCKYAGDEKHVAIFKTPPPPGTEITQNCEGYDVTCLTSSYLKNLKSAT